MRKTLRDTAIDLIGSAVWLSLLCVLGMAPGVLAQGVSGRIVGSATDSSGAVVANAHVTVTNQDTGVSISAVTDARGEYRVTPLYRRFIRFESPDKGQPARRLPLSVQ